MFYPAIIVGVTVLLASANGAEGATLNATSSFSVSTIKKSFIGAWIYCQTGGMKLASVMSSTEEAAIESAIQAAGLQTGGYWIGGVAESTTSEWYWTDSSNRVIYTNWGTNQPSLYGEQSEGACIRVGNYNGVKEVYKWEAVPCQYQLYFVCRYDA
ncbi:lithostathine-1-alpha-like [Sitophilus oryzae]|uniref:Lithostathine-1-alpha-like n=1 Tax=Sitophilus oryzae TaxID=7048 RepID=A0A6J2Y012_SITOR|nr:lithostathine-1-alpha-like [Sitophilus oryzae]